MRIADHERASAIDRVDDDEAAAPEALEIVIEAVTALTAPISLVAAPEMIAPVP